MYQLNLSKSIASTCIACAFLAAPIEALAQAKVSDTNYGIGLGVIPSDEGYKGIGLKTTLIPAVRIQTPRFSLRGTSAEFLVTNPANKAFSVNLRADLLLQGYKAADGAVFTGMSRRDPSLLVGVGVKYTTPVGQFWAETGVDATGNSKGMRSEVGVGWRISTDSAIGKWTFSPCLSAQQCQIDQLLLWRQQQRSHCQPPCLPSWQRHQFESRRLGSYQPHSQR